MDQVLKQAMELTAAARYQLAMHLLASLEPVLDDVLTEEERAELDRRSAALHSGADPGIPGDAFLEKLRSRVL
jgi:putative addiction module component (TIGR02574 family)